MNGLRQLRDATGAHQVGWRSPTVDDNETASQQHGEESHVMLLKESIMCVFQEVLRLYSVHRLIVSLRSRIKFDAYNLTDLYIV